MTIQEHELDEDSLQERLYILQNSASEMGISCYVILEGWAQTGKGRIIKKLIYRMDPKKYKVYSPVNTELWDSKYPFLYKYWYHFPPKGFAFFLLKSWYYRVSYAIRKGDVKKQDISNNLKTIMNLERTLAEDGILIIKFFLDLGEKDLSKRLKKAKKEGKTWETTLEDLDQAENYESYKKLFMNYIQLTDQPYAPWILIPSDDNSEARLSVMVQLINHLEKKLGVDSNELLQKLRSAGETE
ncbi:hypothetical protein [Leptospira sp. GIMC2001]|uniref:hypothetical protein n=1 Tax=Leptospira sp. GIMC2001 TaxID=1513297 RepID=UPI002348F017|nr:hypothetical protein [Leptospira sp. GIMC2001]WCL48096.1 hypothetical protein O4O04_12305 [Leptospira sp. GIMC2001]